MFTFDELITNEYIGDGMILKGNLSNSSDLGDSEFIADGMMFVAIQDTGGGPQPEPYDTTQFMMMF